MISSVKRPPKIQPSLSMIMNTPTLRHTLRLAAGFAAVGFSATLGAQTLLSHYTLDGNGDDSGSLGIDGQLINDASYVSGGVGTFSEALSTSDGTQDFFRADTSDNPAYGLDAITISLWVNVSAYNGDDRLVSNLTSSNGFDLYLKGDNLTDGDYRLAFGFNSTSGAEQSADNAGYQLNEWVFLAVTYDSTDVSSGENISFYLGNESNAVSLTDTGNKTGSIVASVADLEVGGTPATSGDRTPSALFNDVRIYNGVLNQTELESIRATAIPEPGHYAMALGALALGALTLRRRRA